MPIIFTVGIFSCDKFEETINKKASGLSKLTEFYLYKNFMSKNILYFLEVQNFMLKMQPFNKRSGNVPKRFYRFQGI